MCPARNTENNQRFFLSLLQIQEAIQVSTVEGAYTEQKIKERYVLREAAVLYPVKSSNHILQLHKFFTMRKAKKTFSDIRKLQTDIQETVPNLPPGRTNFQENQEVFYLLSIKDMLTGDHALHCVRNYMVQDI